MTNVSGLHLSLSDIARLAGVQRPVVSMWRKRPLTGVPFPSPVDRVGGEERFDAQHVADYLAATRRGLNPEASDDLAAHARLTTSATGLDETVSVPGLTALLCLGAMTDESLGDLSAAEVLGLAREVDPHDTLLVREIADLDAALPTLAAHAEDLASASYTADAAFARLLRQRAATAYPGLSATMLTPAARSLVARTAIALAADAGGDAPLFVDVADGGGDLLRAVVDGYAGELAPSVATLAVDSPIARLARRRMRVHDVHRVDVQRSDAGDFTFARGGSDVVVHVLQLPCAGEPGLSDIEVLDAIDNLVLQLDDDSRVVVIGPASALVDRPSDEVDRARDAILRGDRLRAAVRLPKGMLPRSPRQPLALWALGPAHPAVAVRDRWTVVADVSNRPLDCAVIDGIVTDVVAAMTPDEASAKSGVVPSVVGGDDAQVVGHRFRFARRVATSALLAGRASLVDRARTRRGLDLHEVSGIELAATMDRLLTEAGAPSLGGLVIEAAAEPQRVSGAVPPGETTVGQAITDGLVRVVPGNRLRAEDVSDDPDGRRVVGAAEVSGAAAVGRRRIDLLAFAELYPSGRFTEPGDVVVSVTPRGAYVDRDGGSIVEAPARVLRITEAGRDRLLPEVLARDIAGSAVDRIDDWQRWPLRLLPRGSADDLAEAIAVVDRERATLSARLAALERAATTLVDGAASGALTVTKPSSQDPQTTITPSERT